MDIDRDELDFDLELPDFDDVGLPPPPEPGPERGPSPLPVAVDPELPLLTPVILGLMTTFSLLYIAIMLTGGEGGPALAWILGGAVAVLYVGAIWLGALFFERHR